ncbi:restriction endonuclease subunit S [Micromonospora sp. CPCC 206061]|uniref:restriction endonuclease subunit S n=1 Tax=Micromonospora sp. CPCC 206061 TaxID=3122410 RepID=UPI003FA5B548
MIRPGNELVPEFLQRYLSHPLIREYMLNHNSGGSRRALTKGHIERFEVVIPPEAEQRAIASVLGALDGKIAINEQIAQTALNLAGAIFDRAAKAEVMQLGTAVDLVYGKALRDSERRPGEVPVFGCTGRIGWHSDALTSGPSVVIGRKGANAGCVSWSPTPCWVIDTAFYAKPKLGYLSPELTYFLLRNAGLSELVGDSAVPGLNRNIAATERVSLPAESECRSLTSKLAPLLRLMAASVDETRCLSALRDMLLPRLVSGALRIKDIDRLLSV